MLSPNRLIDARFQLLDVCDDGASDGVEVRPIHLDAETLHAAQQTSRGHLQVDEHSPQPLLSQLVV